MRVTVLQVGEGRFLRAFLGVLVAEARARGTFAGRLVVTAPRPTGRAMLDRLRVAGGAYDITVFGPAGESTQRISPVDRVIDGYAAWPDLLAEVCVPGPVVIISNTTEAGLAYQAEDPEEPVTYPGRLTALLAARHHAVPAAPTAVIPCELITDNGAVLHDAVARHAGAFGLDGEALLAKVAFADTLVDRIVTSREDADALHCFTEPYLAWYIAGLPDWVAPALGFDPETVHFVPSVTPARNRKLRLLNGTHTLMAATGLCLGLPTVRDTLEHGLLGPFVRDALRREAVGSFPAAEQADAAAFAEATLERFANPGIVHALDRIALQMTAKVAARWVPIFEGFRAEAGQGAWPRRFALGLAAYLHLARGHAGFDLGSADGTPFLGRLRTMAGAAAGPALVAAAAADPDWPGPRDPGLLALVGDHLAAIAAGGLAERLVAVSRD